VRRNKAPPPLQAEKLKRRLSRAPESVEAIQEGFGLARGFARVVAAAGLIRNLVFVVVAAAILVFLWLEVRDTSIFIEPINVPTALVERGLTSIVLTDKVVDRIGGIAREMGNPADAPEIRATADVPEFRVITFGPSLQSVGRQVRRAIGRTDTRIAGAVTRSESAWHVAMRDVASHVVAESDVPNIEPLQEAVVEAAAVAVLRISSPDLLMNYQYDTFNRTRDPAALVRLEDTLNFLEGRSDERTSRRVRYVRALLSFERGDFRSARESYTRMAKDYPGWTKAKSMAAMAAMAGGQYDDANIILDEIVQSNETDSNTLTHAASTLEGLGRYQDAFGLTLRAMRSDPDNEIARWLNAEILCIGLHRPSEAVALLNGWTPKETNVLVRRRVALALCYLAQGDLGRLQEIREMQQRQFPDTTDTNYVMAMEAELRGKWRDARAFYEKSYSIVGRTDTKADEVIDVSRVLLKEGSAAAAIPLLKDALADAPYKVDGRVLLAKAYAMSGQLVAADAEYAKVVAADPDDAVALEEWSEVLAKLGRPDDASVKATLANEAAKRLTVPLEVPILRKP
jgi:tetratricopeptide (TPR) repeat protein